MDTRSASLLTKRAQPLQPPPSLSFIHTLDHADQSGSCRRNADQREVLGQALETMRAEPEAVDKSRHAHRHDDTRSSAARQLGSAPLWRIAHGETGSQRLFEEMPSKAPASTDPQRMDYQQMLGPVDRLLGNGSRYLASIPLLLDRSTGKSSSATETILTSCPARIAPSE